MRFCYLSDLSSQAYKEYYGPNVLNARRTHFCKAKKEEEKKKAKEVKKRDKKKKEEGEKLSLVKEKVDKLGIVD